MLAIKTDEFIIKTKIICKSKYRGSSKFDFWNTLEVGDEIYIGFTMGWASNVRIITFIRVVDGKEIRFETQINKSFNYLKHIDY